MGWALGALLFAAFAPTSRAALFDQDFSSVVARVLPAVVNIAAVIMPSAGAGGDAGSGLAELNGNLAAVGKSRNSQSHGCRSRAAAFILGGKQAAGGSNQGRNKEQSHGPMLA